MCYVHNQWYGISYATLYIAAYSICSLMNKFRSQLLSKIHLIIALVPQINA